MVFSVTDDGVGLREAELRGIFEPFRRGRRLKSEVPGSGLGLSIIRRIVEAHDGMIEVRSQFGSGSTFIVTLPVETPETAALQTECGAAARG